ncbi:MAG TPA: NADH-ubiquinone oxidoreductase-F iron-sulfur binding region domain-containing protein, partial [Acidimicrobiales bacterium]|nr:NADH-ubiquinone oxidoreductase-F iron-sulfur binding region domain-containing protein [Acidimicrobiales bacterium]
MRPVRRVLSKDRIDNLDDYLARRGGEGLAAARQVESDTLIETLTASGLRGRGGAGFPTGIKWRTMVENRSFQVGTTVVVNSAEGEPGTFKDRSILRQNPYHVLEGALIAAVAVGADRVIFGMKRSFTTEVARVRQAMQEAETSGWAGGIAMEIFEGPDEYLYGEETALLEAIDGRYPFPRLAPPYRRGVRSAAERHGGAPVGLTSASRVDMAGPLVEQKAPPALVDNVETLANIPRIVQRGAEWFRTVGTEKSPGTIVCTVTGSTRRHGVAEVIMGTPLREVIEAIGGGPREGHQIKAVLPGVANGLVTAEHLDTPVTYEDLRGVGSGLGSGGFIVLDETVDLVAVAAGVSRFLGVESCGQCTPCKQGGIKISKLLADLSRSESDSRSFAELEASVAAVADSARCFLAHQHEAVMTSVLANFSGEVRAHLERSAPAREPYLVAELLDIVDGEAVVDARFADKQPDWSFDEVFSGKLPADHLGQGRHGDWSFKPREWASLPEVVEGERR